VTRVRWSRPGRRWSACGWLARWAPRSCFPPDQLPTDPPTSYTRATIHYINRDSRQVNQADPGGHITTTEYDPTGTGNTVRQLSAAYRAAALATGTTSQEHADRAANSTPRPLHP
jgi:hypothetical protein